MHEILNAKLLYGEYKEAEELCNNMDEIKKRDIILSIAYETESLYVYSFVEYMIKRTGLQYWRELAIEILLNPLCFLEGAYSVALYYARESLSNQRNAKNLERLLFFYNIPEKLLGEEEAELIAKEILTIDSHNEVARSIFR